jgi:periplasmic protein TonB
MRATAGYDMPSLKRFPLSRRGFAALVIAGHVGLIYVIATSLGFIEAPQFAEPMQTTIIDAPQPTREKPPTPKVELAEPELDVPMPETPVEVPVEEPPIVASPDVTPTEAVPDAELNVQRRIEPVYPPASRRAGEEGTVTVRVLVDERGKPGEVQLQTSSGHARLDEAAIAAIRKWTFAPARRGTQAVPAWTTVRVTFQLNS